VSTEIVIAIIAALSGVVASVVTWFLSTNKRRAEVGSLTSESAREAVETIKAVLETYKEENRELRDSIDELKDLNKCMTAEILDLKKAVEDCMDEHVR